MELEIRDWIHQLNTSERPNSDIIAFHFGLIEKPEGYGMYLIGSKEFDENDDDWACNADFEPKRKYLDLSNTATGGKQWNDILTEVTELLKKYSRSAHFSSSIFSDAVAITTGFDDGDLVRIT